MNSSFKVLILLVLAIAVFLLCGCSVYYLKKKKTHDWKSWKLYNYHNTSVVPISAYFDPRSRQSHKNATVVLISVERSLKNSIVGCEIDGVTSIKSLVKELGVMEWVHHKFKLTHTDCVMYCWDMKVNRDSEVKVVLRLDNETRVEAVKMPVVISPHGPEMNRVMICATGFGTPALLEQWLIYQQVIGVKMIHLNVMESFSTDKNTSNFLSNLENEGIVRLIKWKEYLNSSQVYYNSQTLKYLDCILRYQNVYRYVMIVDFDEYFIPAGPIRNINTYAQTVFKGRYIGSIYIPTIVYPCRSNKSEDVTLRDGNITHLYDTSQFIFIQGLGKSIHRVQAIQTLTPHRAEQLFRPNKIVNVCDTPKWCKANYYVGHFSSYPRYHKRCKTLAL